MKITDDRTNTLDLFTTLKSDSKRLETESESLRLSCGSHLLIKDKFCEMCLDIKLIEGIYKMGHEKPSLIQGSAIPLILEGGHLAVQSKSGTGKTIAFATGMLSQILQFKKDSRVSKRSVVGIVVAPTKELCCQVSEVVAVLGESVDVTVYNAVASENRSVDSILGHNRGNINYKDFSKNNNKDKHSKDNNREGNYKDYNRDNNDNNKYNKYKYNNNNNKDYNNKDNNDNNKYNINNNNNKDNKDNIINNNKEYNNNDNIKENNEARGGEIESDIVVGTIGTILYLIKNGSFDIEGVKICVLDEADACLEDQTSNCQRLLKMLKTPQLVFFSATYSDLSKNMIKHFAPGIKELYEVNSKPEEIKLFYMEINKRNKTNDLLELYEYLTIGQMVVFVNYIDSVKRLKEDFENDKHAVGFLHGKMDIDERERAVKDFREARTRVLISTDVFARGMDIPQVNLIVNYDMPVYREEVKVETYLHRIGRSGRFGRTGFVIDFIADKKDYEALMKIQEESKYTSKKISLQSLREIFYENE